MNFYAIFLFFVALMSVAMAMPHHSEDHQHEHPVGDATSGSSTAANIEAQKAEHHGHFDGDGHADCNKKDHSHHHEGDGHVH